MVVEEGMLSALNDMSGYSNLIRFKHLLCIEILSYLRHHGIVRLYGIHKEEKP